jgi:hypothetical protein
VRALAVLLLCLPEILAMNGGVGSWSWPASFATCARADQVRSAPVTDILQTVALYHKHTNAPRYYAPKSSRRWPRLEAFLTWLAGPKTARMIHFDRLAPSQSLRSSLLGHSYFAASFYRIV